MFKNVLLSCAIVLGFVFFSGAQNYKVNDYGAIKTKSIGAGIIGMDKDGYIYASSMRAFYIGIGYYPVEWVKVFNSATGQLVTERRLKFKEFKSKGYKSRSITVIDKRPFVLLRNKSKDYAVVELDRNLNPIGKLMKIGKETAKKGFLKGSYFDFYQSKGVDGIDYFLSKKSAKKEKLQFSVIGYDENAKKQAKFDFKIPALEDYRKLSFVAYDADNYFLFFNYYESEKKEGKLLKSKVLKSKLYALDASGEVKEIELELDKSGYAISDMKLTRNDDQVVLAGNIIKEDGRKFVGIFSSKIDLESNELEDTDVFEFDQEFIEKYSPSSKKKVKKLKKNKKKGPDEPSFSNDFIFYAPIPTEDGGAAYFSQKYNVRIVTRTTTNSKG